MSQGRRCSVPMSAVIARSISLTQNLASASQMRMSHAVTKSMPAPTQALLMAAMVGLLHVSKAVQAACAHHTELKGAEVEGPSFLGTLQVEPGMCLAGGVNTAHVFMALYRGTLPSCCF